MKIGLILWLFASIFRGVAKVVSRQFRVLETAGSSPTASTKKERVTLAVTLSFLIKVGVRREHGCAVTRVRIPCSEIGELAHQAESRGIFALAKIPPQSPLQGFAPTLRTILEKV